MEQTIQKEDAWWAVAMRPDQSDRCLKSLSRSFENTNTRFFNPMRVMIEYCKGEFLFKKHPLYPGYAFVQCAKNSLDKVVDHRIKGFYGPVKIGKELIPVKYEEIDQIMELTNNSDTAGVSYGEMNNNRIQITSGPLKGKEGVIVKLSKRKHRAAVLVSLGNKKVRLELACIVNNDKGVKNGNCA